MGQPCLGATSSWTAPAGQRPWLARHAWKVAAQMLFKTHIVVVLMAVGAVAFAGPAQADVIDGTNEADVLVGTAHDDFIRGFDDDDELWGGGGRDQLRGGQGDDRLVPGKGVDFEQMLGGGGNDTAISDALPDYLAGGFGNDRLLGRGEGDWLEGSAGRDLLSGGAERDFHAPGYGADTVLGGDGRDYVLVFTDNTASRASAPDVIDCGPGEDTVALLDGTVDPNDEYINCENIRENGRMGARVERLRNRFMH